MTIALTPPLRAEQRKSFRHAFTQKTFCYLNIRDEKMIGPVEVRNLSAGGISLILDQRLALERALAVSLYNKTQQAWSRLEVQVVYTATREDGECIQGYAFTRGLSSEDVWELL